MPRRQNPPWDKDHEILARLAVVASMMNQGAKPFQIAQTFGYTLRTAYRDIERVYTLMRREAIADVIDQRNRSIAQYREIQAQAWAEWRDTKKASYLRIALEAEARITELQGTRQPVAVDVTSGGETLAFSARDLSDDELAAIAARRRGRGTADEASGA